MSEYLLRMRRVIWVCVLGAGLMFGGLRVAVAQGSAPPPPAAGAPAKAADAQVYRDVSFGFRYKIPFGWVERTEEMRAPAAEETTEPGGGADSTSSNAKAGTRARSARSKATSDVLLAVFERPPAAAGEGVNSAVVIAAESAAGYPGLKTAEDFLGPLTELTTAQGFKVEGDPSAVTIDGRELVRADFTKALTEKVMMYQSTLAMVAKGQIVSFTFIAGSAGEVEELMEGLGFGRGK
jgi:hypothetical protein